MGTDREGSRDPNVGTQPRREVIASWGLASISTVPSGANIWVRRPGPVAVVIWLLGQGSGSGQNDAELLPTEPWHRCGPIGQLALCEDRIVGAAIEDHGDLFLTDVDAAPDVQEMTE